MWAALSPVISLILKALLELFIREGNKPDEAIIVDRNPARRERLRSRVREVQDRIRSSE